MTLFRRHAFCIAALGLCACAVAQSPVAPKRTPALEGPKLEPATAPATRPSADVAPDAEPLLAAVTNAYRGVKSLSVQGEIKGDFDVAGRHKAYSLNVSGLTDGNGRFIHRAEGAGLMMNDGTHAYLFDSKRNTFAELPASETRIKADEMADSIVDVLLDEDPSLLLAVTDDAAHLLKRVATAIHLPEGKSKSPDSPQLVLELPEKRITLRFDPKTKLIIGSTVDYTPILTARHATQVRSAAAVLTYAQAQHPTVAQSDFSWSPPADATEFSLGNELMHADSAQIPTTAP